MMNKKFMTDFIFILIFIFRFLAVILDLCGVELGALFQQSILGTSNFGFLSGFLIAIYFIIWGMLKIKDRIEIKWPLEKIILKGLKFIGLTKPSSKDALPILLSHPFFSANAGFPWK